MSRRATGKTRRVDINTASVDDLAKLNGIGRTKAESIIEARKVRGGFRSVDDLLSISGIGKALLDQNRGMICCSRVAAAKIDISPSSSQTIVTTTRETRRTAQARAEADNSCEPSTSTKDSNTENKSKDSCNENKIEKGCKSNSQVETEQRTARYSRRTVHVSDDSETSGGEDVNEEPYSNEESEEHDEIAEVSGDGAVADVSASDSSHLDHTDSESHRELTSSHSPASSSALETGSGYSLRDDYTEEEEGCGVERMDCAECGSNQCERAAPAGLTRSLRSRIKSTPSASEKHWMKRKCEGGEGKGMTPGKKPCRTADDTVPSLGHCTCGASAESTAGLSGFLFPGAGQPTLRKRLASRTPPPPQLRDWIKTFQSWSAGERLVALDDLIESCEPTQVRHMMAIIEPQFQRDFISLLPKELALYVLSFLEPRSLLRAAQTCRYWRVLAEDNLLWKEKCREESIDEALVFGPRGRRRAESSKNPWKTLYMRQKQIEFHWRSAPLRPPKVLKGHDDHVITCLEFSGNRIVSGSDDNTLKVWSAITGKCLRTLVGHTGGVWSSQMAGNLIISGSTDRTLKVWNADTGSCIHTLYGHSSTVRCMHLYEKNVVSGSRDATLRLWDIDSGQCLHVLMGHVAAVRCVQYDGKYVVSGAYDYMVKVWDPDTETCLHTLQGHTNRVYSLQFDGTHIVSGSLDTSIRVWDVETGNCLHTLIGHQSLTSGMELKDNILVSGNADSTVKVWDITTGQCLQTLQGPNKHQSAVTCLQFNKKFAITSSDDGSVKIWDVQTGEFLRNLVALDSGGSGGVVWRIRCCNTKLVCAVGSRNGTEETKLLVLDFDMEDLSTSLSSCTNSICTHSGNSCCGRSKSVS